MKKGMIEPVPSPSTHIEHLQTPLELGTRATDWFVQNWVGLLTAAIIGFGLYVLLTLIRAIAIRICRKQVVVPGLMGVIGRAAAKTSHLFMILVAARLVVGYAEPPERVVQTIAALFIIVTTLQVAIWLREIALGLIEMRTDVGNGGNESLANAAGLIRVLLTVVLFAVALIFVLDNLGVNVTGIVAGLGVGGIAIGLAAQGIFSDLFAALSIIFDKPFVVGETINFGSESATVERIGLKSTRLRAITGEKKIVSNAQLLQKEIISYAGLASRRVKFAVGVIYQTAPEDAAKIPDIMKDIIESVGASFVRSGFVGFGASSLDFEVEFDVMSGAWDEVYVIRHRIGLTILQRFNDAGLEFAYPTQTTFTADPEGRMVLPYPTKLDLGNLPAGINQESS